MPVIPLPQPEPAKWKSLALALVVHALLIGALFLGVQWKSQPASSVEVEVWRAAPPPTVKPESKPEPELKPEPKPVPKLEIQPPLKPDIVVKEEKKPKELPKKPEPPKEEVKKPDVSDWKKELAREQKEVEQRKAAQDQRARADAESLQRDQLKAEQASAARSRGLADYAAKVRGKIRGNIVLPPNIQGNPLAEFEITQLPSGEVLEIKVRKSSGNPALDAAIERAVLKSSPLPKPDQSELFQRTLRIPYKPFDD